MPDTVEFDPTTTAFSSIPDGPSPIDAEIARLTAPAARPAPAPVDAEVVDFDPATTSFTPVPDAPAQGEVVPFDPAKESHTKVFSLDDLKTKTVAELDKESDFHPVDFNHQYEDALNADPISKQKLLDVYKLREDTFRATKDQLKEAGAAPGKAAGSVVSSTGTAIKSILGGAGKAFQGVSESGVGGAFRLLGAASVGGKAGQLGMTEEGKRIQGRQAEIAAGVEMAGVGTADLVRRGVRTTLEAAAKTEGPNGFVQNLTGVKPTADLTNEEWATRLSNDVAGKRALAEANRGAGEMVRAIGLHADELKEGGIEVRPEVIAQMSPALDITNLLPLGAGAKVGIMTKAGGRYAVRELATAATPLQASAFIKAVNSTAEGLGKLTKNAGELSEAAGVALREKVIAPIIGRGPGSLGVGAGVAALGYGTAGKAILAAKVVPRALEFGGKALQGVSRAVPTAVNVGADIGSEFVKGYGQGLLFTAPFMIGADAEEREGLLGAAGLGGIARGGIRALGHGKIAATRVAEAAQEKLADTIFKEVNQSKPPVDPETGTTAAARPYETDLALDEASAAQIAKLDKGAANDRAARIAQIEKVFDAETARLDAADPLSPKQLEKRARLREEKLAKVPETITAQQNLLGWAKNLFKDTPVEFYATDDAGMMRQTGGQSGRGYAVKTGQTIAPDGTGKPLIRVFLNGDVEALPHEMLHALGELDAPGYAEYRKKVNDTLTPEQRKSFEQIYNTVHNGGLPEGQWKNRLTPEKVTNEIAAELFSRTVLGEDLSGVTPSLRKDAALWTAQFLEGMGIATLGKQIDPRGVKRKAGISTLGLRPAAKAQALGKDFVRGLLRQAKEGEPIATPPKERSLIAGGKVTGNTPNPISRGPKTVVPADIASKTPVTEPSATPASVADWMKLLDEAIAKKELIPPGGPAGPATPTSPGGTPPAPAPATPGATTPGVPPVTTPPTPPLLKPRNIRTTESKQGDFAAQRHAETKIDEAKATAEKTGNPDVVAHVEEISKAVKAGTPLEIEYQSVKTESGAEAPAGRGTRRTEQENAYIAEAMGALPEDVRELAQKVIVPVRWETVAGKPQLLAMSLDKVIANIHKVAAESVTRGVPEKIPYEVVIGEENKGTLSPPAWHEVVTDFQDYANNQANGYRGDGKKLIRPTEDIGVSIPAENPAHNPVLFTDSRKVDFLNMVQGLNPPLTAREVKGKVPGNVKGQILAEINARTPEKPAVIGDIKKQTFKTSGRDIMETNPLRNELAAAGVRLSTLIEVTERLSTENIAKVTPRPDINFKAPVTDIIRGGFLPGGEEGGATMFIKRQTVDEIGREVLDANPEQWQKLTSDIGGLTGAAYKLGNRLKDPADVVKLWKFESAATAEYAKARATQDFDGMMLAATKKQFFTEALETATGMNPGKQATIARVLGEGWKPPFPEGAKGQLLPKVEDPRAVEFAAIRNSETGEIFPGSTHGAAMRAAEKAVGVSDREFSLSAAYANPNYEQGFVTQGGKFLDRAAAMKRVEEIGQISPENLKGASQLDLGKNLESVGFEFKRNFLPGEPIPEKLNGVATVEGPDASGALEIRSKRGNVITPESQFLPKMTGWILPNQKFVPLDNNYHEQYLANESKALNKRFGTKFSDTADVNERLAALNKGFVRLRGGTGGGGAMNIELNAKFFKNPTRPAIEKFLEDQAEDIDTLNLTLLNDKGKVVDSTSARVFELDGEARVNALLRAVDDLRLRGPEGNFLPGGEETLPGLNLPSEERAKQLRLRGLRGIIKITTPKAAQDFPLEPGDIVIKKKR